jgi:hypothetical protein
VNRALPGTVVDLIRDGVPRQDLARQGDRAVWNTLVRTATSAVQRGWTQPDWQALVEEPQSHLGTQARIKRGKAGTRRDITRTFTAAWGAAEAWVATAPAPFDRAEAVERARAVRDLVADADLDLDDNVRAILATAAGIAERNGTDRPALPRRTLMAATGLNLSALRTTLTKMDRRGLLTLAERGRPGGPAADRRRANLYRLPNPAALHPYLYRETRSVVPPAQFCGAPEISGVGAPVSSVVPPHDDQEDNVVTLTIRAHDPEALAEAVRRLGQVQVEVVSPVGAAGNVVPIRGDTKDKRTA